MVKFKVLQSNQRFLSSILRVDIESQKSESTKSTANFFTSIPVKLILLILFNIALLCAVRMCNQSYDFTARLTAALVFIAMCQAIMIFLSMGSNVKKIVALYQTFQTIVDDEGLFPFHTKSITSIHYQKNQFFFS